MGLDQINLETLGLNKGKQVSFPWELLGGLNALIYTLWRLSGREKEIFSLQNAERQTRIIFTFLFLNP